MSPESNYLIEPDLIRVLYPNGQVYRTTYVFPNDVPERERLALQSEVSSQLFGGKLFFSPLDRLNPPRYILDIATGLGDWAIQMGVFFPSAQVIATDLSPIQPKEVPPNVIFFVEDSSDPWDYSHKFDFIHTRVTSGCWASFEKQIVQQAFDALEPGAYFESQELDSSLGTAGTKCDRSMITGAIMKEACEEVGFVDVQEIMFKVPTNGWAKDGHLKEIGKMWEKNLLSGLSGFSLGLFHRTLNMSPEEVEVSLVDKTVSGGKGRTFDVIQEGLTAKVKWVSPAVGRSLKSRVGFTSALSNNASLTKAKSSCSSIEQRRRRRHNLVVEATMIPSRLVRPSRHLTRSAGSTAILLTLRSVDRPRPFAQSRLQSSRDPHERLKNARPLVPDVILRKIDSVGRSRNSRAVVAIAVIGAIAFYFYNSQTVPVTGRRRFNFLSDKMVQQAHSRAAEAVILAVEEQGGHFLSDWDPRTILVKRVMKRLIPVSGLPELDWEVRVIADDRTANAFVLPGGKVFVHSGILDVCRNEDALAAVLGHEIAHNTASHVAERLSAAWVGNLTTGSLFFLAGALPGLTLFALWTFAGGFYLQDFLYYLPMGRKQESEADYIGLMMMAEACYDPRQAVGFWQRMEMIQKHGGSFLPESLSTHPSNEYRINKIKEWLPVAMEKRRESDCSGTSAFADRFRIALRRGIPVHEV
ncbi:hypothetical protein ED733_008885 [Metarhizium rileyi]|uniref:Peptidase M48 domain-containing protein n=1 Tax=Metarhizium rileyi (strain RCEF 4871) TaxID=1649241 RepID=A0A5C6GQG1_METRR|nr:hypothetical protein ED733_008885 [Metarhizium rileyi]